jgi:anti-sigma B factor antagonist
MRNQSLRQAPAIVVLPAEIDISNAQRICDQLHAVFATGATVVVADLTSTVFCDTTGLHALVKAQRRAAAEGAQLRLVISPGGPVHRVLELMGLDRLLPVFTSRDDATGYPGGPPAAVRPAGTARLRSSR